MTRSLWNRRRAVQALFLTLALAVWTPVGSGQFFKRLFNRKPAPTPASQLLVVDVLDVGQGDAILIRSPEGRTALIDAGLSKNIVDRLEERGISEIDLVVVSHPHTDHYGGMDDVIKAFRPKYFLATENSHATSSYVKLLKLVKESGMTAVYPSDKPRKISLGSVVLTVLPQPPEDPVEHNNNSIGIRLQYGSFSMLMTGDSEEAERAWWMVYAPDLLKNCQILKLAHHGSHNGTDSRWLQLVNPRAAVVSLGQGNSFGHPHPETLHLLASANIPLYRTDRLGTITIRSDGRRWAIDQPDSTASPGSSDKAVRKASSSNPSSTKDTSSRSRTTTATNRASADHSVPIAPEDEAIAEPSDEATKINLNTASRSQLERIPGVGAATAKKIIQARPFQSVDEVETLGVSHAAMSEIRKRTLVK